MRPPIEEALKVARPQRITRGLQRHGIGTREKPIVQTLEPDPLAPQLLLHPLVAVQTDPDRVRDIRADLDEGRSPRGILQVKVIVIDGDRLSGEVERHAALWPTPFVGLEGAGLLLR